MARVLLNWNYFVFKHVNLLQDKTGDWQIVYCQITYAGERCVDLSRRSVITAVCIDSQRAHWAYRADIGQRLGRLATFWR